MKISIFYRVILILCLMLLLSCVSTLNISEDKIIDNGFEDNFKGKTLDNNKWQEYDNNERVLRDIDNALFISSDSRKKMGGGGIVSKFYIAGDFDAEISYKIEKWSEDYASLFFFIANWARDSWIRKEYISIRNLRYYSNSVSNDVYSALRNSRGVFQAYGTQNTKDMKGKLRIKRTHGEIFTYYGSYGEWILLQSYKEEDNQPFRVGVGIRNWNRNHGPSSIRVRFTDFKLKLSPDVLIKKESEDKKKENKNNLKKLVHEPELLDKAQISKIGPEDNHSSVAGKISWAIVVGISNYEDTRIPSLRYAASDAQAFHDWLVSSDGGGYPPVRGEAAFGS